MYVHPSFTLPTGMALLRVAAVLILALVSYEKLVQADCEVFGDATDEARLNGTSASHWVIPKCSPDYAVMQRVQPKLTLRPFPNANGVCVNRANGDFVATAWQPRTFVYLFNRCGWIKKRIELPKGTSYSIGCVFSYYKLFYAATRSNQILQFNLRGTFEKVFTTGFRFARLAVQGSRLYSSIESQRMIRVYDTRTRDIITHFETITGNARGLAFNPSGNLHVAIWGRNVEVFTPNGRKLKQVTYTDVSVADGLVIDKDLNTVIADRGRRQVLVYNFKNMLIKRITGFSSPVDVDLGYKCMYMLVADRAQIYML